ncbi:MAG: hypothetical protein Q7K42_04165 [Candidatus Diapherotrites archaeon]|nr:hypothetical protein [Candidatus Diapherotrites archaeon]
MAQTFQLAGLFLLGIAVGTFIPALPKPLDIIQPFLGLILIIVAAVLIIKGN